MTNEKEKIIKAYDKYAERVLEDGYRFNPVYIASKALSDWVLLTSIDLKGKTVLNIGCAEPIDELQFVERVDKWISLDLNPKIIKAAREIAKKKLSPQLFSKLEFVTADATKMPFDDEMFDIVTAFSTIEHIPSAKLRSRAIDEMTRVCKTKGYVIVTIPNKFSTYYFAHRRNFKAGISDCGYEHLYSFWELKKEFSRAGLKCIRFGSEYNALRLLPSYIPLIQKILYLFLYFGERFGFIGQKV